MATTFADLTPEQKAKFQAEVAKLGLQPNQVAAQIEINQESVVHEDPAISSLKTTPITVTNLAHLKDLGGIPDSHFEANGADGHITYPAPLPADRVRLLAAHTGTDALHGALSAEERGAVHTAVRAFVSGDSTKVPQHLVDLANATHFPMQAAAAAAQDITISAPLILDGSAKTLVFGVVTVKPGGTIICKAPVKFSAQRFIKES